MNYVHLVTPITKYIKSQLRPCSDDLTTIATLKSLAQLSNYPIGVKLAIQRNGLIIQPPGVWQSFSRTLWQDSSEDIALLKVPIDKAIDLYTRDREIGTLIRQARNGLIHLKKSYHKESLVFITLELYIKNLDI